MDIQAFLKETSALRPGIRPLPVHVGAVLVEYAKNPALAGRYASDMIAMIEGIKKYQAHPWRREETHHSVVWREGQASLLLCPAAQRRGAVLLVPSMINKSAILDLLPERSFMRWLAAQGHDVYLLDWGTPVKDGNLKTIGNVIERIVQAMDFVRNHSDASFHAMGYCMGGTLLAAAAMQRQDFLRGVIFFASPWDFHAGDRILTDNVRAGSLSALQMIEADEKLPANWIQSIFAVISAERTVSKFAGFSALDPKSEQARLFVAVEDWLNDGIDFPGGVARTCILEWYGENRPGRGEWIDISQLEVPALVIASASDRLVPMESSLALAQSLPHSEVLKPAIGHIGMMTGNRAEKDVWRLLGRWLER